MIILKAEGELMSDSVVKESLTTAGSERIIVQSTIISTL